jgi:hypothetical protein
MCDLTPALWGCQEVGETTPYRFLGIAFAGRYQPDGTFVWPDH